MGNLKIRTSIGTADHIVADNSIFSYYNDCTNVSKVVIDSTTSNPYIGSYVAKWHLEFGNSGMPLWFKDSSGNQRAAINYVQCNIASSTYTPNFTQTLCYIDSKSLTHYCLHDGYGYGRMGLSIDWSGNNNSGALTKTSYTASSIDSTGVTNYYLFLDSSIYVRSVWRARQSSGSLELKNLYNFTGNKQTTTTRLLCVVSKRLITNSVLSPNDAPTIFGGIWSCIPSTVSTITVPVLTRCSSTT